MLFLCAMGGTHTNTHTHFIDLIDIRDPDELMWVQECCHTLIRQQ